MKISETAAKHSPVAISVTVAAKLDIIAERLKSENKKYNLTALTEDDEIAILHFADCMGLVGALDFEGKKVIDIGCGGGFPSLVIAAAVPSAAVLGLDSTAKKLRFVEETASIADIQNLSTLCGRAEDAVKTLRERYDIAVSRGVSRLNVLAELCLPYVKVGGVFAAMKGGGGKAEAEEAERGIGQLGGRLKEIIPTPIPGGEDHCVVVIEKLRRTPPEFPRQYARIKSKPL